MHAGCKREGCARQGDRQSVTLVAYPLVAENMTALSYVPVAVRAGCEGEGCARQGRKAVVTRGWGRWGGGRRGISDAQTGTPQGERGQAGGVQEAEEMTPWA